LKSAEFPFRVRIGVTGHRALPGEQRLRARIREVLAARTRELLDPPSAREHRRSALAYTVVSSLAEGADCLVVEEVLKTANSELEAVLPLAAEDYLRDFSTRGAKARSRQLLDRARKTIVLNMADPNSGLDDFREKAYEEAGRYVVDHCDLLIAVWNGMPARGRGGTAEIVSYARSIGRPLLIVPTEIAEEIRVEKGSGVSGHDLSQHVR
jgi:hypothetical protein